MSPADLDAIRHALAGGKVVFGPHARREMAGENPTLLPAEIEEAVAGGEIIEDYPDDPRGPCCLILGFSGPGRPVHTVVTAARPEVFVITAYVPDPRRWEDYRRRRTGGKA